MNLNKDINNLMKKVLNTICFALFFNVVAVAQTNPIQNLTWSQWYEYPNNFFQLQWEAPAQPHNALLGYNIYRNGELYGFQTETSLYSVYSELYGFVFNCNALEFLGLDNQDQPYTNGFEIYVTAVYDGNIESEYLQTVFSNGLALKTNNFGEKKAIIFPNPTTGVLNIGNQNLTKIIVCDFSGKVSHTFEPNAQIDLGFMPKGFYLVKLISESEIIVGKIVLY